MHVLDGGRSLADGTPQVVQDNPDIHRAYLGEKRMQGIFAKYGKAKAKQTVANLLLYSEKRMRAELEAIPDGIYSFEDFVESDGVESDKHHRIYVDVHKTRSPTLMDYLGRRLRCPP